MINSQGNCKNYNIARIVDEARLCFKFSVLECRLHDKAEVTFRCVKFLAGRQDRTKLSSNKTIDFHP